jgi:type II secretory pathway pseudopilin PulG
MRRRAAGFTLVEATITIAIIAMAAAVVVPAVGNISQAELRATSSKISAFVRATYDDAALTGRTYRMVFDFESRAITSEFTEGIPALEPDSNILAVASERRHDLDRPGDLEGAISTAADELRAQRAEDSEEGPSMSSLGAAFLGINSLSSPGMAGEDDFTTNPDMKVELAESQGKVYLYFFPHGYTQDAVIHLEDDSNRVFSVVVQALTGRPFIEAGYREVNK